MDERLQLRFNAHGRDLLFKRLCGAFITAADGDDLHPTWEHAGDRRTSLVILENPSWLSLPSPPTDVGMRKL